MALLDTIVCGIQFVYLEATPNLSSYAQAFYSWPRFVAGRIKTPLGRINGPVTTADGRQLTGQRHGKPVRSGKEGVDQGCIADREGWFGKRPPVKNRNRP